MQKYKTYAAVRKQLTDDKAIDADTPGVSAGTRIDLARNFRSRSEVVDGVNAVFRSIMRENVAEMDYDARAELVCGAAYPPPEAAARFQVEFAVLNKEKNGDAGQREAKRRTDRASTTMPGRRSRSGPQ